MPGSGSISMRPADGSICLTTSLMAGTRISRCSPFTTYTSLAPVSMMSLTWTRSAGGPAGSDDVEVDSGAFSGGGGFDERAEAADDASLAADDFADVFLVDFELVDGGVAILDLVDFNRVWLVDERAGDVFDQALQVGLELIL